MSKHGHGSGARRVRGWVLAILPWLAWAGEVEPPGAVQPSSACSALTLPVQAVSPPPTAYNDFCRLNPVDCRPQGPAIVAATEQLRQQLQRVNREVNAAVRFMPDTESVGQEEDWRYPSNGRGDCEDIALEKRRRLVAWGVPRSALTMAIVYHRARLFPHAVLLAETTAGTLVLDNLNDALQCWNRTPYNFEARERNDGRWDRYDQRAWYDDATGGWRRASPCGARRSVTSRTAATGP